MRLRRHEFGADYLLDCVVRLTEIVKRQQFLIREMLDARPPYIVGGEQTIDAYLYGIEERVLAEALAYSGTQVGALKVLGVATPTRYYGKQGQRRRALALKPRIARDRLERIV